MWFTPHYLRSKRVSQKSELSDYMLSKNTEVGLCAISLQVTWVAYFRSGFGDLVGGKLPEGGKVCYH